jgi:hypothetical protein
MGMGMGATPPELSLHPLTLQGGSGLVLLDEATQPGVQIIARRIGTVERPTTTGVTLTGADGQPRVIRS